MKLKEIIIGVVAVALVVIVAVGATLAYLTATDEETNVMTVGDIELEILEFERVSTDKSGVEAQLQAFTNSTKKLIPSIVPAEFDYTKKEATINWDKDKDGKEIKKDYTSNIWDPAKIISAEDKMVFVKNTGKYADAYVRLYFAFEAGQYASFEQFQNKIRLNINETEWVWKWDEKLAEVKGMKCFVACATYKTAIAPGELTNISLSQIALDVNATNADSASFGDKYDVLLVAQGIQSEDMGTAEDALNNGFGTDVPFAGFRYVDFADLKTALHYLDANVNGTTFAGTWDRPNTLLNTVTFGLFEDYYEKVLGHDGVATTNASGDGEFAGYTYYVPNGDKYDLYVLTDSGVIYMPKKCANLFYQMTALKSVNTDNMDVSKVTTMSTMFKNCWALEELDVTGWDVGKVTSVNGMFENCASLTELAVGTWQNVNNITEMSYAFMNCNKLTYLDISNWKFDKVTTAYRMFCDCRALTEIKTSDYVFGKINMDQMFQNCSSLSSLDVSGWNVTNAFAMNNMFSGCSALTELAVSQWNVQNVTGMNYLFSGCSSLSSDNFDVSGWNVSKVSNFSGMFSNCSALTALELSDWTTTAATSMYEMFQGCSSLTKLDLSNWNTRGVRDCELMFAGCSNITTIYVGNNWDMSNVPEGMEGKDKLCSDNMFKGCRMLRGQNGTTIEGNPLNKEYARVDTAETPGYLTQGPAPANP